LNSGLSTDFSVQLQLFSLSELAQRKAKSKSEVSDCTHAVRLSQAVFEKTCEATQNNVKSHVFLDFEKKNVKKRKKRTGRPPEPIVSQAT